MGKNSLFLLSAHKEKYVYKHCGSKPLSRRPPAVGFLSDVGITETWKCGEGLAEMRIAQDFLQTGTSGGV